MATVTFQKLKCNSSSGTVMLSFQVPPNPVWGPGNLIPGVDVSINKSRSYSTTCAVTVTVNTSTGSKSNQQFLSTSPGSKTLHFPILGVTYTLTCHVS